MSHDTAQSAYDDRSITGVLQAMRAFGDALDRMHGDMKGDMDMNATDLAALRMLVMREQRRVTVSPHDLARHLRISTASTSKLLDRLSAAGHIERKPHPHDGRARVIALTDQSRRSFFQHFGARLQGMRGVAERYTPEELDTISRFILEICEVVDPS